MGFASKFEDEIERRGGDSPRYRVQRCITAIEGLAPQSVLTLGLDDAGYVELDKLITNFVHRCAEHDANKSNVHGTVGLKALFRSFDRQKEATQAVVFFLAPRIRRMRGGGQKRLYQRAVATLRKRYYIF